MIKIMDRSFNLLGQIDDPNSIIANRSFFGVGTFEMHLDANVENAEMLKEENIVFFNERKAWIILHSAFESEDEEVLIIKGLQLKSILGRYITIPPTDKSHDYINSNIENIMYHFVRNNVINPIDIKRKESKVLLGVSQGRGTLLKYQTRYRNLAEELEKIGKVGGLGWDLRLDFNNKKFVFEVLQGLDRRAGQVINPPAIFKNEYDNIARQEYISSKLDYRHSMYIAGQGEGVERTVIEQNNEAIGMDRYELFVDARDIDDDDLLEDRGKVKAEDYQKVLSFESEIIENSNLTYEVDYNMGDIVTVENVNWGVTLNTLITEITEIYEENGFRLELGFGNTLPTLAELIKEEINKPLAEGGGGGLTNLDGGKPSSLYGGMEAINGGGVVGN